MPSATLRLFRDELAPRQARALPAATRVLYVQTGDISVSHLGSATPLAMDHAWHGTGACAVTAGERDATLLRCHEAPRLVRPGGAWFESGREPVLARASRTEPTSFIRVSILPAEIRGQSSIVYVDPADATRGRPRRYTVWVDTPIEVV
jgi:hypothetical protein